MMRVAILMAIALALGGCVTDQPAAPLMAEVIGPTFSESQFACGQRPLPPDDPNAVGPAAGSAAAHYENRLGTWGQSCANRLTAIGAQLKSAGQVVTANAGAAR
jgi:hypothetical protein